MKMNISTAEYWRKTLADAVKSSTLPIRIMEVCGTHTHTIARNDLRLLLPHGVELISGPGCPICVSGVLFIEKIRSLLRKNITVFVFGDLLRIPGADGLSLMGEKNLKTVYSPADALTFAMENPRQEVIFAAVGFAPTLSAAAALMDSLIHSNIKNFSLLADFKEILPVLHWLCNSRGLSALLLPGHVASVVGSRYFAALPVPGAIAGFTAENILHSIKLLLDAIAEKKKNFLFNNYPEAVRHEGNLLALEFIGKFFELTAGTWRGLGTINNSAWSLKNDYKVFDAAQRYDLTAVTAAENPACRCGEVLTGMIKPQECSLFGKACTPENPVGSCMSSSEGSCSAEYIFGGTI